MDGEWAHRIPRPILGISDEMFDWGNANMTRSAEFIGCWGLRWGVIKKLNGDLTNRGEIIKLLKQYKKEYDIFLKKSWAAPPSQLRDKAFIWGHLISHCVIFEKVMISNALITALIPEQDWVNIQKLCLETVKDLGEWKNKTISDVTLCAPYYKSIHAYAGFRLCLPKLDKALDNYPKMDYKHVLRVGVHALKFLKGASNIFSLSTLNWEQHYTYLQNLNWHILALKTLHINTDKINTDECHIEELKKGELHALYYDDVDTDKLDVAKYTLDTYSQEDVPIPDMFKEYDNVTHFSEQSTKQKDYVEDLCLRYPKCIPKYSKASEYEAELARVIESVDIVKTK